MAAKRHQSDKEAAWRSDKESVPRSDEEAGLRNDEQGTLASYLLGLASAEEREGVEKRLLIDSDYLNELQMMEERLIDEYVSGEMQEARKAQFENHFLKSAEHREDLEFAGLLNRHFPKQDVIRNAPLRQDAVRNIFSPPVPRWRAVMEIVLASAVILFMSATSILLEKSARLNQERAAADEQQRSLSRQLAEQQQAVKEQQQAVSNLELQLAEQQIRASLNSGNIREISSVSLSPGLDRAAVNARQITIPVDAQILRLNLKLQGIRYSNYRAEVETVDGSVVWSADGLKARNHTFPAVASPAKKYKEVVLMMPTKLITHSQYLIKLTGFSNAGTAETVGTYYMEIGKK